MPKKLIQDIVPRDKPREDKRPAALPHAASPANANAGDKYAFLKKKENVGGTESIVKPHRSLFGSGEELPPYEGGEKVSKNSRVFLWILGAAVLATALFLLSSVFSTATLTVTPRNEQVSLADTYPIAASSTKTSSGLHFQVISLEKSESRPLAGDGTENVERKATGTVVIYNNYSATDQRLITNTRLETTAGLIYRIRQSADVPGIKTVNGVKTPGSVSVEAIADEPGDKYNMKVSDLKGDFTIPGFAGTDKFDAFYARLASDMTGGYEGPVETVSSSTLSAARASLTGDLKAELVKELYAEVPANDILLDGATFVETTDLPDSSTASNYTIAEDETVHGILFDKSELASFIAANKLPDYDGTSSVSVIWGNDAKVAITGTTPKPWTESSLKAAFSGSASVVWSYDPQEILNDIAGQNASVLSDLETKYQNSISNLSAKISPPWRGTFPADTNKISVVDAVSGAASR